MKRLLHTPAVVWWSAAILLPLFSGSLQTTVYFNDFNGPLGVTYPEWTSSGYANAANLAGTISSSSGPQTVTNVDSPNRKQRFLGEFGGPKILTVPPYDASHFVRVDEALVLTLRNLEPHSHATVSFDLYILKSWDGNNPNYGPDRWSLKLGPGTTLLDTTFSNNFKTGTHDLSLQNYPALNSSPKTGATAVNSLGYRFYGDSIYHLTYTFPHRDTTLILCFSSSLFEGKGTEDESWGLDNVRVSIDGQRSRLLSICEELFSAVLRFRDHFSQLVGEVDSLRKRTLSDGSKGALIHDPFAKQLMPVTFPSLRLVRVFQPDQCRIRAALRSLLEQAKHELRGAPENTQTRLFARSGG